MKINRRCDNEDPHTMHAYTKHWLKEEVPLLPDHIKEQLPEEWDATYHCPGIEPEPIDPELQAAIETYESHQWNATSQLCECGERFEASNVGHTMHRRHRMAAVRESFKLPKLQHVKHEHIWDKPGPDGPFSSCVSCGITTEAYINWWESLPDQQKWVAVSPIKEELHGLMDSLDDSVIKDEKERQMVYGGLHALWWKL